MTEEEDPRIRPLPAQQSNQSLWRASEGPNKLWALGVSTSTRYFLQVVEGLVKNLKQTMVHSYILGSIGGRVRELGCEGGSIVDVFEEIFGVCSEYDSILGRTRTAGHSKVRWVTLSVGGTRE